MDDYRVFRVPRAETGMTSTTTYVLLHGLGLSHRSFTALAAALSMSGETIAIDLPGFGGTAPPKHSMSVEDYAAGVGNVLTRINAGRRIQVGPRSPAGPTVVLGHSMGAQVALELALTRPELVDLLVMAGPVVDLRRRNVSVQGALLLGDIVQEPIRTKLMAGGEYVKCGPVWFLDAVRSMLDYPTHERIKRLKQPLLVIRGEHDVIANESWCAWLCRHVNDGELTTIPEQWHNAVHTSPDEVAHLLARFAERSLRNTRPPAESRTMAPRTGDGTVKSHGLDPVDPL